MKNQPGNANPVREVVIFYFSGTGNARQITSWFCSFATEKNINCQALSIEQLSSAVQIPPGTLIGIISPIHGFNFPKIMLDFIRRFPRGKSPIFLMCTRGGAKIGNHVTPGLTGVAFFLSSFCLRRKGYTVVGQVPFDMPSNWISLHPAINEKSAQLIRSTIHGRVKKHAGKILSGQTDFLSRRDLVQDILIMPVSLAYYVVGRFFLAKSFYASYKCNRCGLCIRECPVKAIQNTHQWPFWTFKCESCMRCMNACPQRAIETAHGLLAVITVISLTLTGLFYKLLPIHIESGFVRLMIFSAVFLGLLFILYRLQHRLLKHKLIGKLISFTSLTHFKFWGRFR